MRKALAIASTSVALMGAAAGSAFAATRYAAPTPLGSANCSSPASFKIVAG